MKRLRPGIALLFVSAFAARTYYGTTIFEEDNLQVYLIGLKWYTTGIFPYWGPDVIWTQSHIPGGLQGLLTGIPFLIKAVPESPFILLNLLSMSTLCYFGWYASKRIPAVPEWFIYTWLLTAPWTLHYSTIIENPSYVLPAAIMFFISIWELFPLYDQPIIQRKWAFFWLGFALFWIMQLHLSWVLMPPFIALAFYFQAKKTTGLGQAILFFLLGAALTAGTLAPSLWLFGRNAAGGSENNIAFNPANLLDFFIVCGKYLSFAAAEVVRFVGTNTLQRMAFLKAYPWAAPFTVIFTLLGLVQVGYLAVSFFISQPIAEWRKVRTFSLGAILLVTLSYLFTSQPPSSHAFYLMLPVAMWYSFYCYVNLFKIKYIRAVFALFLLSGMVFQAALSQKNAAKAGFSKKRELAQAAIQKNDYSILGLRRESGMEISKWGDIWQPLAGKNGLFFQTGYEYSNPSFKPQNILSNTTCHGSYACKIDSLQPFGLNFREKINAPKAPAYCTASTFLMGDLQGDIIAVMDLQSNGKNIYWKGQAIPHDQFSTDVWQPLNLTFAIPDTLAPWDEAKVYLWLSSKSAGTLFIDDATVGFFSAPRIPGQ